MRDALCAVNEYRNSALPCVFDNFFNRADGSQGVGHMRDANQEDSVIDEVKQRVELDLTHVVDRRDDQLRAGLLANQLPGHDVGVVLEVRDQDLVTGLQARAAQALCNQVDRLGGATRQDNLIA